MEINMCNVITKSFKYFILGVTIASVSYTIPKNKIDLDSILIIAAASTLIYAILDIHSYEKI